MNKTFWKFYAYLSLPISLILLSVILYNIFIAEEVNNFLMIPLTIISVIIAILSIKLLKKSIK